ncbi:MAG: hypothetical protein QXD48_02495 [Candidatus Aenigmatarchaeota archaeon]
MQVDELEKELFEGIKDGRRAALEEAPYLVKVAGLKNPNYYGLYKEIKVSPLPPSVLGATDIAQDGSVIGIYVNRLIPYLVKMVAEKYRKGKEWAKEKVYKIAKLTTEHELAHALSSYVAKGEKINDDARNIMESISTYAKHKVAKLLRKNKKAEFIKEANPYPTAWFIGNVADRFYKSEKTGEEGYAAFIKDAQTEPFYKTLWRLAKQTTKGSIRRMFDYFRGTGVPKYVPA